MAVFIVESVIPEVSDDFMLVIPKHIRVIQQLMNDEKVISYAVSDDRKKWWCHIKADSEFEVMDILSQMPIMPFLNPQIYSLLVYNYAEYNLPKFSLN
jgi:hypothetical protein